VQTVLGKVPLVRVRLRDGSRICPRGGTRAQVDRRRDCSASRGIGERAGPAGNGVCSCGSDHTLVASSFTVKESSDGKEYAALSVGCDEDFSGAKVPLIVLDTSLTL
jgi:hypothetical protein